VRPPQPGSEPAALPKPVAPALAEEIDVVDAHWMALTMWGEARNGGEEAMRAVGHVIDNRRRSGAHGAYATETVSEAWQFSCWNRNDPNYAAMLNVDTLRPDSEDQLMWLAAKRVAEEILAGRSIDPTGGALFYHNGAVSPRWSAGLAPVSVIGGHLFFRTAR
jgi:N-acetylmuramoyl-L-alanine amidase